MVITCPFPQDYGSKHLGKPANSCDFYLYLFKIDFSPFHLTPSHMKQDHK